jgi:heat-inducible transcriptional repressor
MVRYIVGYSNFIDEEIYRTGFSKLLLYPDFADAPTLAESLALFENARSMRLLLRESLAKDKLKYWIGEDLKKHTSSNPECAVLAIPYRIHGQVVGAIGILGPKRMPYKRLFGLLRVFSEVVSEALTRNIYKFKLQYRQPQDKTCFLTKEESLALKGTRLALLEDKTGSNKKQ